MIKSFFSGILLSLMIFTKAYPQQSQTPVSSYTYHRASADKPSWQRLHLKLATIFYKGMKLNKINYDSSMIFVGNRLGISRLLFVAEGMEDEKLLKECDWFDKRDPGKGARQLAREKGKRKLELMILLGTYYSYEPQNYKKYLDSIEYFLKPAVKESEAANEIQLNNMALYMLGKTYATGADTVQANAVFNQLLNQSRKIGDKKMEAIALQCRGEFTAYRPYNLQAKITDLENAVKLYQQIREVEKEIQGLTSLGFMYMFQQKYDEAHTTFLRTLELEKQIGYPYTNYTLDHLSMLTMAQGKFGEPLKHTLEGIKAAETTRDNLGLQEFYLRLGQLYYMEGGRIQESLKWMKKSLDRLIAENEGGLYSTVVNMVSLMNENGGTGKEAMDFLKDIYQKKPPWDLTEEMYYQLALGISYQGLKQYSLAEKHVSTADSIQKIVANMGYAGYYQQQSITYIMNSIYFSKGEYDKAKKFFEGFLADPNRFPILSDDIVAYERLIFIDSVFKDDASAVKHYKEYMQLVDSNFRVSKIRQAEELQVMYQTQEKEDQIKLLNQQAKLEHASLQQATLVKNTTIAGIIAALIFLALLYRQNRQKQKSNILITNKNEQLQHLLTEKDWLVKEIHHRVKNNLQTIMGLLGTQSGYLKNDIAREAITDSQRRIQAMSLIHQRLYQSNKLSTIKMTDYIHELVDSLNDSFNVNNLIRFDMQIEPVEIDLAHAIPLGLILNESITNSFKYAFKPNQKGIINISFQNLHDNEFVLKISDNGIGLPEVFDPQKSNSMGMNLMRGLSEEIGAQFRIDGHDGVSVEVSFVYIPDIAVGTKKIALKTSYTL